MHGDRGETRGVLPAHPSSVPAARRLIRTWLADSGHDELSHDAELAVSELVTNALVHAGTPVDMIARLDLGFVRVEVSDGSVHLPRTRDYLPTSGTGRGLKLLERTVDRWGAHRRGAGKVVWFELSSGDDGRHARVVEPDDAPAADAIAVELLEYVNWGALVGQRLVSLIPARFHQAHLAGFTLHLTTGRSPLIGVPVTVPVLLRGGSERLVRLTVSAQHLPGGRRVFVAEMLPA